MFDYQLSVWMGPEEFDFYSPHIIEPLETHGVPFTIREWDKENGKAEEQAIFINEPENLRGKES